MIARDATRMFEPLEKGGFTVRWGQLKVPEEDLMPSVIEHPEAAGHPDLVAAYRRLSADA